MKNNEDKIKVEKLEIIISGLLDEIVTISEDYNIDIYNGESNYKYYKNEFINIDREEKWIIHK